MKDTIVRVLLILGLIAFMAWGVWMQIEVWRECRSDHSWFFCMRLMSR